MSIQIRQGQKEDLIAVFELIKELAIYENALDQVNNSVAKMEKDGFGHEPLFGFFVAEKNSQEIIGLSIYYNRYSTWKGRRLFLEDLIVTKEYRRHGIGQMLFNKTLEHAKLSGCSGLQWQVLDWNELAINFYKKYETNFDEEWINCAIEF